ncbi:hypothetical protein IFR05_003573 [Cadophora sp. M221]|nr:hypothetical protein IFR05_003573 [Cadophora sp. M221]
MDGTTTTFVRIQPTASGPTYQVTIELQSTWEDDQKTHSMEKGSDDPHPPIKSDILRKETTDPTTSQACDISRDSRESAKHLENEGVEQPTGYEAIVEDSYTKDKESVLSEGRTAHEQGKDDEVQRDLAERRMKALDMIPEDDKEEGREDDKEDEQAMMARMDAEIEEIRIEVEKMRVLAQAAEDELSHCGPCGLRLISHDLMDDQIVVSRRRIKKVE